MTTQLDDPRVSQREDLSPAQKRKANEKSPVVAGAKQLIAALDWGDTVCVPRWYANGNTHPEGRAIPWLQSVSMILVDADDTVHPA
jgi:hypothetical protein